MNVTWFGQSAFHLSGQRGTLMIDPFDDVSGFAERGIGFNYPQIRDVDADLVLVTHEHLDHNGVGAVAGSPAVLRSTAGVLDSPLGQITAVASEHDPEAGTRRGPNTIFVLELDGIRLCHFGDFGQSRLRDEQRMAIGAIDLLFVPVGGGPTIDAGQAREVVEQVEPRWVVPMHYRTPAVDFLDPPDAFLDALPEDQVRRLGGSAFDTDDLPGERSPTVVVPEPPL